MANTIVVNDYRKKMVRKGLQIQIVSGLQFISLIAAFFTKGITLIPMFIFLFMSSRMSKTRDFYQNRVVRVEETKDALTDLDDSYTVLHDVELKNNKHTLYLDHVIVGDNGVFVLKTKDWVTNKVTGEPDDHEWTLSDSKLTRNEKNPIKQVKTQIHFLSKILKEEGMNVWIQGMVYCSNRSSYYDVDVEYLNEKSDVPVFLTIYSGPLHMYEYITNYKPRKKLSKSLQKEIVDYLKRQGKR